MNIAKEMQFPNYKMANLYGNLKGMEDFLKEASVDPKEEKRLEELRKKVIEIEKKELIQRKIMKLKYNYNVLS